MYQNASSEADVP